MLGLDEAEHLGEGGQEDAARNGEKALKVSCNGSRFLCTFSTQMLADPLIALENLTFCQNEETKLTALPVAW